MGEDGKRSNCPTVERLEIGRAMRNDGTSSVRDPFGKMMEPLVYIRDGSIIRGDRGSIEVCAVTYVGGSATFAAIPITPEKALDLAVELLKLAAPIMRAKAYGAPYEVHPYDGTSVRDL